MASDTPYEKEPSLRYTLPKQSRLRGKKTIDQLFAQGKKEFVFPLRVVYAVVWDAEWKGVRLLPIAQKKRFRKAVMRNTIRRMMRESFRLQVHSLSRWARERGATVHIACIAIDEKALEFAVCKRAMERLLCRIEEQLIALESSHDAE